MTDRLVVTLLTAAALLSGVVLAAAAESETPLAGTQWRLVEFQSMDDSIGAIRPEDPSRFTMRLNADGTVNMHLDCNRANGTWSAEASADPSNGRFAFGPLAATRALCPPPNLDERVTAQAEYVRGYLLKDGRLHLSLFTETEDGLSLVDEFPISRTPVIVSPERTGGWNDLVRLESGGGAPASYVRHTFDGEHYVEKERLPADPAPEGRKVLAGELSFQDGIPLEPRS